MVFYSYDSQPALAPAGVSCWICLEEGADDSGGQLMQSCACRGESGFVHSSCLGGYACRKSEDLLRKNEGDNKESCYRDPWNTCPTCHQLYTGHLKLGLAKYYIEKTQSLPENNCKRMSALMLLAATKATEFGDYSGGIDQYKQVLAAIQSSSKFPPADDQDFVDISPRLEVECLEGLGMAYGDLGDESMSLFYLEKAHKLGLVVYGPSHPLLSIIADQLNKLKTGDTASTVAGIRARLEECREHFGENHEATIMGMIALSEELVRDGKLSEAHDLCKDASKAAKRSLGPAHETTKSAESHYRQYRTILDSNKLQAAVMAGEAKPAKLISPDPSLDGTTVFILRPVKHDFSKYVCAILGTNRELKKVKILLSKLILKQGTPVQCQHMASASHLNGKRGTVQSFDDAGGCGINSYEVEFDDGRIPPRQIKVGNLMVVLS